MRQVSEASSNRMILDICNSAIRIRQAPEHLKGEAGMRFLKDKKSERIEQRPSD